MLQLISEMRFDITLTSVPQSGSGDKDSAEAMFNQYGFTVIDNSQELTITQLKWDTVCPLFLSCIPADRNEFAKSKLVLGNYFIIQDRTFSMGPSIVSRLLDYYDLTGDILQTHIDSPRSTAYLAALFYSVNRLNCFYVYGAGSNLKQYRRYIEGLGINNTRLFAESFTSFPLESNRFRTVVGVFANPPNSFSAISDPIDLICSRGGDLGMLEILTDTSISDDGKFRVSLILEEQLRTLSMAMSRPQVQFVLYQTHSIVNTENEDMTKHAVKMVNEASLKKHRDLFIERKRLEALEEAETANIPSAAMGSSPRKRNATNETKQTTANDSSTYDQDCVNEITLPEVDEFMLVEIPDVCKNQDNCIKHNDTGCFLSLVQRKQITRLNAKYLIHMAEKRGLFGNSSESRFNRNKPIKSQESNTEHLPMKQTTDDGNKNVFQSIETLISRLEAPTSASKIRSNLKRASKHSYPITFDNLNRICKRKSRREITKLKLYRYNYNHRKAEYPMKLIELRLF
ncbi:uncharacterized protein LOC142235590 [Haematobia irritans]|uniref:uncharacterized protein LOC142235590 n=1 Tax=Haematobia irritans TaxID=7368 RepID=UPI003F4FDEF4